MNPSIFEAIVPRDDGPPSYPALVVSELIELKREGHWTFERAWSIATAKHLPPSSWTRSGQGTESPFHFFGRHCKAAWFGGSAVRPCGDCGNHPCGCEVVEIGKAA